MSAVFSYVNLFSDDIDRLAGFYASLFDLEEILESRSQIFRGFRTAAGSIGFSAPEAYDLLGLSPFQGTGDRVVLTFDVLDQAAVDLLTERACDMGAQPVQGPFKTYYGWYQSVLRDLDGNAFRINARLA